MKGVEKFRNMYYLDEIEEHKNGMSFNVTPNIGEGELVSYKSQSWAFSLGVCTMMPFIIEVALKGSHGIGAMGQRKQCFHLALVVHLGKWLCNLCSSLSGRWRQIGVRTGLGIDLRLKELVMVRTH